MIDDFLGIAIVGAILSLVIQWSKKFIDAGSLEAKILTIFLSVVVGTIYVILRETGWLETVMGVLAASSTVFALLLKTENPT